MPKTASYMSESPGGLQWQWTDFAGLCGNEMYLLLAARQQVFMLEQQCLYPDIDERDRDAWHLLGWQGAPGARTLAAYLRCFAPGIKYPEASLGRVLTVPAARGQGIGKALLAEGLRRTERQFPGQDIRISAQQYLERFYRAFGFATVSEPYDEDGIPHIEMLRQSGKD